LNRNDAWKTWAIVIGLLIFTGIASAAWLWLSNQEDAQSESQIAQVERETEPITISIGAYVLGDELLSIPFISENIEGTQINPWLFAIAAFAIVAVLIGGMGFILGIVSLITSRQVSKVNADEEFQASIAELNQRDAAKLKELQESRVSAPTPTPERRLRWSVITTSLLILVIVWIAGLAFGVAFFGDTTWEIAGLEISAVAIMSFVLIAITLVVLVVTIRSHKPGELDSSKTDYNPVNWNYVWVVLTGALIFGLGAGLAIAMTSITGS
jgi:hypothetical protein